MPARKFTPPCTPCHQPLSSTVSSSFLTFHLFATAFRSLSLRCPTERFYAKALFEKFAKLAHVCVSACVSVAVMCVCVCVCACAAQSSRCWGNSNREYLRTSHATLPANKPKAANTNLIRAQHEQRESRTRGGRRASGRGGGGVSMFVNILHRLMMLPNSWQFSVSLAAGAANSTKSFATNQAQATGQGPYQIFTCFCQHSASLTSSLSSSFFSLFFPTSSTANIFLCVCVCLPY